jgi:hypothetical protein
LEDRLDDLTRKLTALLKSGDIESLKIEAVIKPRPCPAEPPFIPTIGLVFGPDFDPPKE